MSDRQVRDMGRKHGRTGRYLLLFVMALLMGWVLVTAYRAGKNDNIRLLTGDREEMMEGWTLGGVGEDNPIVSFPCKSRSKIASFYYRIPDEVSPETLLVLENHYQKLRVLVEGQEIYEYGMSEDSGYFIPANMRCYIDILPEYAGKRLEVYMKTWGYGKEAVLYSPVMTTRGEASFELIKENRNVIAFCLISWFMSSVLFVMAAIWAVRRDLQKGGVFGSLAFFMFLSAAWVLTDSSLLQLFLNNSQFIIVASFEAFLLLPVPLLWFMDIIFNYEKTRYKLLQRMFVANCILQNLLYISKVSNFVYLVWVTHVIILGDVVFMVYHMVKATVCSHSYYAKRLLLGSGMFACMSGLSILTFYHSRGTDNQRFFMLGYGFLVLELLLVAVRKMQEMEGQKQK